MCTYAWQFCCFFISCLYWLLVVASELQAVTMFAIRAADTWHYLIRILLHIGIAAHHHAYCVSVGYTTQQHTDGAGLSWFRLCPWQNRCLYRCLCLYGSVSESVSPCLSVSAHPVCVSCILHVCWTGRWSIQSSLSGATAMPALLCSLPRLVWPCLYLNALPDHALLTSHHLTSPTSLYMSTRVKALVWCWLFVFHGMPWYVMSCYVVLRLTHFLEYSSCSRFSPGKVVFFGLFGGLFHPSRHFIGGWEKRREKIAHQ